MFQLPSNPNLEHLKQQAKDLLKAYQSNEPSASSRVQSQFHNVSRFLLADAQLVIAREYGFSSWTKIKLYIEALQTNQVKPVLSARKALIRDLTNQLIGWASHLESETLGERFSIMPLRDILAVREIVVNKGQHSMLVNGLLEGLKHLKPRVRYNCAVALDHLADERCTEPLRYLLNDPVARVRRAALHSLSCDACKVSPLPDRDSLIDTLIAMAMHDSSIRVRRVAALSLVESCNSKAVTILQMLSQDKDTIIRRTASKAVIP
jgi:HEAT repeats